MTEKKLHWKTAQKLAKESEAQTETVATPETPVEEITEVQEAKAPKAQKGKTEWVVSYEEHGRQKEFTYRLSDTEDAYERALKLALKKQGKVI